MGGYCYHFLDSAPDSYSNNKETTKVKSEMLNFGINFSKTERGYEGKSWKGIFVFLQNKNIEINIINT